MAGFVAQWPKAPLETSRFPCSGAVPLPIQFPDNASLADDVASSWVHATFMGDPKETHTPALGLDQAYLF